MFTVRLPRPNEDLSQIETFDYTKLSAVNVCPTWGIVRYGHHKTMNALGRSMALEAGSACHDVFAAVRLYDLLTYGPKVYTDLGETRIRELVYKRGHELFGERHEGLPLDLSRSNDMFDYFNDGNEDERTRVLRGCLYILETSGFYDDPSDKRRTMDKLTEACIAYIDRYDFGKNVPYVNNEFVGIENAFDLVVTYTRPNHKGARKIRFTGRIDGVHCYRNDVHYPVIEENKTASRLGDAWEQSFEMSHQVTGYAIAASTITGHSVTQVRVRGLAIPQPRVHDGNGVVSVAVFRYPHQLRTWSDWFVHTVEQYYRYYDDPTQAPKYTHSCNRYFRPCGFIPLCVAEPDDAREIFNEMTVDQWSPLADKAGD